MSKYNFMFMLKSGQKYYVTGTVSDAIRMKQAIFRHCCELPFTFVWSYKDAQYLACSLKLPFTVPEL